jgi:hypothetical protein
MNLWDIFVNSAVILTILNILIVVLVFLVYGKVGIYQGLLWLYMRRPNHVGSTCAIFYLDPMGPWPEVCDICKFVDACEFMAWKGDKLEDAEGGV